MSRIRAAILRWLGWRSPSERFLEMGREAMERTAEELNKPSRWAHLPPEERTAAFLAYYGPGGEGEEFMNRMRGIRDLHFPDDE